MWELLNEVWCSYRVNAKQLLRCWFRFPSVEVVSLPALQAGWEVACKVESTLGQMMDDMFVC